ncbi:hypothetical protein ABW21_db0208841 [Orbilia brochopaga]|nr:hypothetical protein ABW21_db0208841 [Drechslerella brochopaga]
MASPLLVAPALGDGSIADTAERARQLLLCCREITDEEPQKLASTQLTRFNLWASNIGVFAARHASLDYRLRTALSVRAAVEGNLDMVCKHLLTTLKASPQLSEEEFNTLFDVPQSGVSIVARNLLAKSTPNGYIRIKRLELVEARITILHQLSLAIRRASKRNILTKIPKLLDFDKDYIIIREWREDGADSGTFIKGVRFDIGPDFEEFVRKALTSRWLRLRASDEEPLDEEQNSYRQTLLARCVAAISTRRRQLAYFRAHQNRLEQSSKDRFVSRPQKRPDATPVQQDGLKPTEQSKGKSLLPGTSKDLNSNRPYMFLYEPSNATHEDTVVSELVVANFKLPPASSVPSSSGSTIANGGFGGDSPFEVPQPPKLDGDEKEKACPYCYLVLPAKTFSTQKRAKRWERHLLEDLQPYVCLFANCSLPEKTYSSFKAWQTHLNQPHYHSWHCPLHPEDGSSHAAGDEMFIFDTLPKFKSHLKIFHPDLDPSSADDLLRHGHQLAALPQWCFVCFEALPQSAVLLQHMVNHFKSMSLLALPWRDDITDEEAMASDKVVSSDATNDNDGALSTEFAGTDFWDWQETDEAVTEPARKPGTQEFASLLSAVNESPITHQDRLQSLETWTQDRRVNVELQRGKWRLVLCIARAVARLRLGARRQREQRARIQNPGLETLYEPDEAQIE